MKKKMSLILMSSILGIIIFTGCKNNINSNKISVQNNRFQNIYEQENNGDNIEIIKDTQTGKMYLWKKRFNAGGLCELDVNK